MQIDRLERDPVYVVGRTVDTGTNPLPGTIGATASEITELGGTGIAVACDHRDDATVARLFGDGEAPSRSGEALTLRSLAEHYGFLDVDGRLPPGPLHGRDTSQLRGST